MENDVASKGRRASSASAMDSSQPGRAESQREPKKPKAASAAKKPPSLQQELRKAEREMHGLVQKLQRHRIGMEAIDNKLRSDEELMREITELLEEAMATTRRMTELKLSAHQPSKEAIVEMQDRVQRQLLAAGPAMQSATLRVKQSKKR